MAAGLGFKTFATGDVLSAADTNGYLMQGVLVFASAAARDSAITSPQEGQFAYLKDTNVTTYYTGSAWANLDTTGMTNPMTTTGDTIYSSSGSTPARLGIGSTGQVLTVAGGVPSWATAGGGTLTVSEIASGSLSGAGLTLSSLSSYDSIYVRLYNAYPATASQLKVTINNNTSGNYWHAGVDVDIIGAAVTNISAQSATSIYGSQNVKAVANNNSWEFDFSNCKNAGFTNYEYDSFYLTNGDSRSFETRRGVFVNAAAVSSIEIKFDGVNFGGGSYVVWGG
jgi:hypothetical protein